MRRLKDKFCSIADAIRTRKGKTEPINCCDLEKEILTIGEVRPMYLEVSAEGILSFSDGAGTVSADGVLEVK